MTNKEREKKRYPDKRKKKQKTCKTLVKNKHAHIKSNKKTMKN